MADLSEYLTVSEAAQILRCAKRTVYGYVERGLLPAERKGWVVLIPKDAVRKFEKPKPGNPNFVRRK